MYYGLNHIEKTLYLPPGETVVRMQVSSCGFCRETDVRYRYHGIKRGVRDLVLLQYTVSGKGVLRYGKDNYIVKPGQALLVHFPHNHEYCLDASAPAWEFLYALLRGEDAVAIWKFLEKRVGPVVTLGEESESVGVLANIIRMVSGEKVTDPFVSARLASDLAYHLAHELVGPRDAGRFAQLKIWCEKQLETGVTVDAMARQAGLSRHHFCRQFRRSEGQSPQEYLVWTKISKACHLLEKTQLSIKEICYACGFSRADHFSKAFRKVMRTNPLSFRKGCIH